MVSCRYNFLNGKFEERAQKLRKFQDVTAKTLFMIQEKERAFEITARKAKH